jgi:hypothetical protein
MRPPRYEALASSARDFSAGRRWRLPDAEIVGPAGRCCAGSSAGRECPSGCAAGCGAAEVAGIRSVTAAPGRAPTRPARRSPGAGSLEPVSSPAAGPWPCTPWLSCLGAPSCTSLSPGPQGRLDALSWRRCLTASQHHRRAGHCCGASARPVSHGRSSAIRCLRTCASRQRPDIFTTASGRRTWATARMPSSRGLTAPGAGLRRHRPRAGRCAAVRRAPRRVTGHSPLSLRQVFQRHRTSTAMSQCCGREAGLGCGPSRRVSGRRRRAWRRGSRGWPGR